MYRMFSITRCWAPRLIFVMIGSSRLRFWPSISSSIIALTYGCWVSR